jgi:hypothetical protein
VVTALGDLEVPDVGTVAEILPHSRVPRHRIDDEAPRSQGWYQPVEVAESKEEIDLRNLPGELVPIPLDEASHHGDRLHLAFPFEGGRLQHRLDGFLLGGIDEATSVDEDHVGGLEVSNYPCPVSHKLANQTFRVDRGFVATEGDDTEFHNGGI